MWSCMVWLEASLPLAQTPALYTSGGALSHQPAEEREEDVELHGLDGGLSPTSSDSSSEHQTDAQKTGIALSPQPSTF
jgi:hypothetical protein